MSVSFTTATTSKPLGKRAQLLATKTWRKLGFHQTNDTIKLDALRTKTMKSVVYMDSIKSDLASSIAASSAMETNSQRSLSSMQNEGSKLFPRNMPSIRRSRRKVLMTKNDDSNVSGVAGVTNTSAVTKITDKNALKLSANQNVKNHKMQTSAKRVMAVEVGHIKRSGHKSSVSKVKQLATTKRVKANCSKNLIQNAQKTPVNTVQSVKNSKILKNSELSGEILSLVATSTEIGQIEFENGKRATFMHSHSQQSSLISYDLSYSNSSSSCRDLSVQSQQQEHESKRQLRDETFLSSGISCNSESQSDDDKNADDDDQLIEAEVARLTSGDSMPKNQAIKKSSKLNGQTLLAASDLRNLFERRNRNAVWLHSNHDIDIGNMATTKEDADDMQLSDIEEQLARVNDGLYAPLRPDAVPALDVLNSEAMIE